MRILQVGKYYHPAKGGIETHLRMLAAGLQPRAEVKVLVAAEGSASIDWVDGIQIERLPTPVTPLGAPISPRLIQKLRSTTHDIVHIHLPNPWAALSYLAARCRRPLVVTYHSDIVRQSLAEPLFRPVLLKFLASASAIICASPQLIHHSETLREFRDRCVVIPFGVSSHMLDQPDQQAVQAIRRNYKKPIILAVGRLVYYKGFEYLIRAMAHIDASLIIIGKGPLKPSLTKLAFTAGVAQQVTFLEHVEDVQPYHYAADIFVLPSIARSEAFGIVQLEAMATATPVINTQLESGVPFVSPHRVTGLTVPPGDSSALAEAINCLLNDQNLRNHYGVAARHRVQEQFTAAGMIDKTIDLYQRVSMMPNRPIAQSLDEKSLAAAN